MSLNNRKGKFKIYFDNSKEGFASWYDVAQAITEGCVIVMAESDAISNTIEYSAYSSYFDEIGCACEIPEYTAVIKTNDNGHPELVEFQRQ